MRLHNHFVENGKMIPGEEIVAYKNSQKLSLRKMIIVQVIENTFKPDVSYRIVHVLTTAIGILSCITAGFGLFNTSDGTTYTFTNQYGHIVEIYGKGLYRHDSLFKAAIFRGTDFTILFIACPLLLIALLRDIQKKSLKSRLLLISMTGCFTYYAASIAFGVTYNSLEIVYILLFAACFFGLVASMMSIDYRQVKRQITFIYSYKSVYWFLIVTGTALFAAWLPDIISAIAGKRSLSLIENYTTEITYVLDMGIIAPTCIVCLYLLKHRNGLGYVLLDMLLTLCVIIGIMLPIQTFFQLQAGIGIPMAALITKLSSFCILALFAFYFKIKTSNNIVDCVL